MAKSRPFNSLEGAPSTCWTEVAITCDLDGVLVVTPQR